MKSTNSLPFIQNLKYILFQNYFTFSGRANLGEFWKYILFTFLFSIIQIIFYLLIINVAPDDSTLIFKMAIILYLLSFYLTIPSIALSVRRLHDINKSGWWFFIQYLPLIGLFIFIYFMITKGDPCENKYGPVPLYEHE